MSADEISEGVENLSISYQPRLSVLDDYDYIANELLNPTNEEVLESKCVHWNIVEWWDLPDRVEGPEFEAGGHRWVLLLFPRGGLAESFVSVYLKWISRSRNSYQNYARAQFALCLSTPSHPTNYLAFGTDHDFNSEHDDWGFAHLIEIVCIDKKNWRTGLEPLLTEDKIRISVIIRVLQSNGSIDCQLESDERQSPTSSVNQPSSSIYQSTISTSQPVGFRGVKSMDDTGCLSILVQLLFYTSCFRRSTYHISAEDSCDALRALIRVFTQLQTSSRIVETTELVQSLGWSYTDLLMQLDIVQFKQALQSALELKCPAIVPIYQRTFGIKYSGDDEYKYELSLDIEGYSDLQEALFDHAFSDGMMFVQLPPVLHIHLRRFWYNPEEGHLEKINDRFTYPLEIDLDPFADSTSDRCESHIYALQSVIVHDEKLSNGMYYAYIRQTCEGSNWIKVKDDQLIPCSESDALDSSYGGSRPDDLYDEPQTHNAYMLSFVRKSRLQQSLYGVFTEDHNRASTGDSSRSSQLLTNYFVSIATDDTFRANHNKFDLFDTYHHSVIKLCISKTETTLNTLEVAVSEQFAIPINEFRLWMVARRTNMTVRPSAVTELQSENQLVTDRIITQCAKLEDQSFVMYLETPIGPRISSSQVLLFIKYFDIEIQSIHGVDHIIVDVDDQVESIAGIINALIGAPIDTQLDIYEEVRPGMVDRLQNTMTFTAAEIQHGDIICAQRHLSDEEKSEMQDMILDVESFYNAM